MKIIIEDGKPEPEATFESGAVLAWLVEREGYREAAGEWVFSSIEELPGATVRGRKLVELSATLDKEGAVPSTRIEPSAEGVRVTSTVRLVVQAYGELTPIEAGQAAVVPYGSVVRAGPLLIAPLYQEQADSVRAGTMALPRPAGAHTEGDQRLSKLDRPLPRNPRRPLLWCWAAMWGASFPASAVALFLIGMNPDYAPMDARSMFYAIGGVWFLLILAGLWLHRLISNFVYAGQPELPDE